MRESSFDQLASLSQQLLSTRATDAMPIGIDGRPLLPLARPLSPSALRFGNIGSHSKFPCCHQHFACMVALVPSPLFHALRVHLELAIAGWFCNLFRHRFSRRGSVSPTEVVSPTAPPCVVTATIAPVSMSTACSALYPSPVRPSFMRVISASGSCGLTHSPFLAFFFRRRSMRRSAASSLASTPAPSAKRLRYSL